ncbi:Asp-tRNA(Asn)/Glu-tRNA(Gln) amidotransferase subunit GatB [Patescibacteria group bacterium]
MKTVIGLEIHAQLKTKSKMFCACDNDSAEAAPNTNVCPICMGHPGTLPVINEQAVRWAILTGLSLNSQPAKFSKFDRKNYFYPDLPKGYQISQYDKPLCEGGELTISDGEKKQPVRLRRIHLEDDAGKLTHPGSASFSLVDYNRAGTPLIEMVTEPDIKSAAVAKAFLQEVQKILRNLEVSDADMEKGQLRCDANISVREGNRSTAIVEIKNMNSFRSVERALIFEEKRLQEAIAAGKEKNTIKETKGWDEVNGVTVEQRSKEEAHDYRYFPEPDLPPLEIGEALVEEIRRDLPEMPPAREKRFVEQMGVKPADAKTLAGDPELSDFFENTVSELKAWAESTGDEPDKDVNKDTPTFAQITANWILSELMKYVKADVVSFKNLKITPENMAEFINIVHRGEINSSAAQQVLGEMYRTGQDPSQIVEEKKLQQLGDESEIELMVDNTIRNNPGPAEDYKNGKENALKFLMGQVMKESQGKVDPQKAIEILKKKLS